MTPETARDTITVALTRADRAADPYFYVPFDVPAGTTRIDVGMAYPKADDCIIDLGVLDPRATGFPSAEGFRGWSGGARDRFYIATDDATPGYVHGPIPAGCWQVILGLYKVPESGAEVTLTIARDGAPRPVASQPERTAPVRPGAGWYRGDLHCHTWHSDARGAPELLHAAARQAGLDFLAVSDHNTTTQRRYFHEHSSPQLVFVRAMEVTTPEGHANVFGVDDWIDFRMTAPSDFDVLARLVREKGGLVSVNHDKPPIPWGYGVDAIDGMEVWQSAWLAGNWVSLARYQARLARGLRITALGGSDYHQPDRLQPEGPLVLGRPTTVLWLEELSERAIIAAMRAGHGYVTEGPEGPHLSLTVGKQPMGSVVPAGQVRAEAEVRGAAGDRLVWIDATGVVAEQAIPDAAWIGRYAGTPLRFLRAEVVADASRSALVAAFLAAFSGKALPPWAREAEVAGQPVRRALSNPVFIEGQ